MKKKMSKDEKQKEALKVGAIAGLTAAIISFPAIYIFNTPEPVLTYLMIASSVIGVSLGMFISDRRRKKRK